MSFWYFKLYGLSWRFVSLKDLFNIFKAVVFANIAILVGIYFFRFSLFNGFPRSILIIDGLVTFIFIASLRVSKRVVLEVLRGGVGRDGKRTIVIGAGNTGEMILRDIQKSGFRDYTPIAFLDDDQNMVGTYLHDVKVVGCLKELPEYIHKYQATAVIIAISTLGYVRLREIYKQAKEAGIQEIKIVPRLYNSHQPRLQARTLEDIKIEDLIGRQTIAINYQEIGNFFENKTVMVTGAAGSIGSEIVNQVCRFNPRKIILFEIDETDLHSRVLALRKEFPEFAERLVFIIGDVRDKSKLDHVFYDHKPDIVFHAAAYKQVPIIEHNTHEAVKVNIIGTHNVADCAARAGVERFIMISTDKAVRPTSVMGATKRVAEYICNSFNEVGKTDYVSVRFGNVLGSRGSVLPLFLGQIQKGEPLTVTHKDMQRYFMTIPEAVSLVLQASVIGKGGDVMVLDMGKPVKIVELAEELVRLHGLEPYRDIDIHFIGLRPGEKLFEEILTAEEGTIATRHEKIFIAASKDHYTIDQIGEMVSDFCKIAQHGSDSEVRQALKRYVFWYKDGATPLPLHGILQPQIIAHDFQDKYLRKNV